MIKYVTSAFAEDAYGTVLRNDRAFGKVDPLEGDEKTVYPEILVVIDYETFL